MDKRKNLHDYSLVLIFLAVLDIFIFVGTVIASLVDGSINEILATIGFDTLAAVKVALVIFAVLTVFLTFAEAFIGFKGLKISREPRADKGYITAAKVFLVLSVLASASYFASFFDSNAPIIDTILSFTNSVLDVAIYIIFIKYANAVRADVLAGENKPL